MLVVVIFDYGHFYCLFFKKGACCVIIRVMKKYIVFNNYLIQVIKISAYLYTYKL